MGKVDAHPGILQKPSESLARSASHMSSRGRRRSPRKGSHRGSRVAATPMRATQPGAAATRLMPGVGRSGGSFLAPGYSGFWRYAPPAHLLPVPFPPGMGTQLHIFSIGNWYEMRSISFRGAGGRDGPPPWAALPSAARLFISRRWYNFPRPCRAEASGIQLTLVFTAWSRGRG